MWSLLTGGRRSFHELHYPVATDRLRVGDVDIAYADFGGGDPPLVLLHGLGSDLRVWSRNFALGHQNRVVAIDLPGFGRSSKGSHPYTMEFYAGCVKAVIAMLGLNLPVVIGHSMGGQIALWTALLHSSLISGLVLVAPAGFERFSPREAQWLRRLVTAEATARTTAPGVFARYAASFHRMPAQAWPLVRDRIAVRGTPGFSGYCAAVSACVDAMLAAPVWGALPDVRIPALVVFGREDSLIPNPYLHGGDTEALARQAVQRLPEGRLEMVSGAGHMVQFERPQTTVALVRRFLNRRP